MKKITSSSDSSMWDIWMSMYHLAVISASDELNLFEKIGKKSITKETLAKRLHISIRPVEALLHVLASLGFVHQHKNTYSLSKMTQIYLLPNSAFYWGAVLEPLRHREEHKKIIDAIRTGANQLVHNSKSFTDMWEKAEITKEAAEIFTKKMHTTIFPAALNAVKSGVFKDTKHLLDAGAGSGCFSIAYTKEYPTRVSTIFEIPTVCDISKQYVRKNKASKRVRFHSGNFFIKADWPQGHDGLLLSQILHDWPVSECKTILKNAYESLPDKGKIYIHEMILDDSKTSPLTTACFDLLMLINHKSQQFNKKEIFSLLKEIGFKNIKIKKTFGYFSLITANK